MKGLVIAEDRRVRVWPATMVEKRAGDVEPAGGQYQHSGCGAGVDPPPRQREAAHAAEPDEQRVGSVKAATATIVGYRRTTRQVEPADADGRVQPHGGAAGQWADHALAG